MSAPEPRADQRVAWEELEKSGLGSSAAYAVSVMSYPDVRDPAGYVAIVDDDGSTRFVETGPDSGIVAGREGRLCASGGSSIFDITSTSGSRWDHGGYAGSGHWAGFSQKHGCVIVLNTGAGPRGYETDVYWGEPGDKDHSVVRAIPGSAGQAFGAVWVREASLTQIPGVHHLYRTALSSGRTEMFMSWPTRSQRAPSGRMIHFDEGLASDIVGYRGRLYYVEELTPTISNGEEIELDESTPIQLRLAEIDPRRRTQTSTLLENSSAGLHGGEPGPAGSANVVGAAMGGHLHGGTIYNIDTEGRFVAVDIEAKKLRRLGRISAEAVAAEHAAAAWHGGRVTLFLGDSEGQVTRETYELATGEIIDTQRLDGFEELLRRDMTLGNAARL